jgi:hypothetical protein
MSSADEPALIDFMQIAGRFSRCLDNVFFTSRCPNRVKQRKIGAAAALPVNLQ